MSLCHEGLAVKVTSMTVSVEVTASEPLLSPASCHKGSVADGYISIRDGSMRRALEALTLELAAGLAIGQETVAR